MQISQQGIDLIKQFEGLAAKAYMCPAGYMTIGYGHKVKSNEQFGEITSFQAHELLLRDLELMQNSVQRNIIYPLNQNQFSALVSFTYNVGGAALQRSTLRQKINYGDLNEAAPELLRWVYVNAKVSAGLIRRRQAEIELFYQC